MYLNKKNTASILLIFILIQSILLGRLPGDTDPDFRLFRGYVDVIVVDEDGNGVSGVHIMANMNIGFGTEEWGENVTEFGTTGSTGTILITLDIWAPRSWGSPSGHYIEGILTSGPNCTNVVSSSGVSSSTSYSIWPVFAVIQDCDNNDIDDRNEMPLAEKFNPTYILNSSSDYVRPEPVQYMGIEKNDLWFYVINLNGGTLYDYPITGQADFDPPISSWQSWVSSNNQNYSWLTFNTYDYTGDPPGSATSYSYFLRFHYNYAGDCNSENCWSDNYENERQMNSYPNTVYVHLFKHNQYTIIQYWSFYPYNDFINNHEGDWEHINVWVNNDDPSTASIVKVEYYFHKKYLVRYSGSFQVDDNTHPRIYVGGQNLGVAPGVHSGGNYPDAKRWIDVSPSPTYYDEWVNGNGPTIGYNSFYDSNPQDNYGIVILPDVDDIDYDANSEKSWFKVKIPWGSISVSSYFGWINQLPFIDESGDYPPSGPGYRAGWDAVGSHSGRYQLYEN